MEEGEPRRRRSTPVGDAEDRRPGRRSEDAADPRRSPRRIASALAEVAEQKAEVEPRLGALPPPRPCTPARCITARGISRAPAPTAAGPGRFTSCARGDVRSPAQDVGPGTVPIIAGVPARFALPPDAPEGERRAALRNGSPIDATR